MYLQTYSAWGKVDVTRTKKAGKGVHEERSKLLSVLALAAFLEMCETWYNMPNDPTNNLAMVCNVSPLDLRQLGHDVHTEHSHSSTPLVDHCCAMCGRLLYSAHSSADRSLGVVGKAAYACQVRTTPPTKAPWDAMP
eukprot:10478260-Karenia_brevis.AAC.1